MVTIALFLSYFPESKVSKFSFSTSFSKTDVFFTSSFANSPSNSSFNRFDSSSILFNSSTVFLYLAVLAFRVFILERIVVVFLLLFQKSSFDVSSSNFFSSSPNCAMSKRVS